MTAAKDKVVHLRGRRDLRALGEVLNAHDRAIGHDWDEIKWEDGPDVRRGRRTIYVTYRIARCTRCSSGRREVFEQFRGMIVKSCNRYNYAPGYSDAGKMSQSEVHTALFER